MSESEEITKLKAEIAQIRKHLVRHHQLIDSPLLKNYAPYKDLAKPTQDDFDAVLDDLRSKGASIDGDNAYKRDVCDTIVGALALGAQNTNPPPADHWAQQFWQIGREERAGCEALVAALTLAVERWTLLANEFKHTTPEHERELAVISQARDAISKATH